MKIRNIILSACVAASSALVGTAHAEVIFFDSFEFESNPSDAPNRWRVYQQVGDGLDWSNVSGAGIEIQHSRTLGRDAADGDYYVELASDTRRGGLAGENPNTTMAAAINFEPGQTYKVDFFYQPRTNTPGDNGIELLIGNLSGNTFGTEQLLTSVSETRSTQSGWEMISVVFTALDGQNALAFRAFGGNNTLGGFIDAVSVSAVPLPASALLFMTGMAGTVAARRKKKSADTAAA